MLQFISLRAFWAFHISVIASFASGDQLSEPGENLSSFREQKGSRIPIVRGSEVQVTSCSPGALSRRISSEQGGQPSSPVLYSSRGSLREKKRGPLQSSAHSSPSRKDKSEDILWLISSRPEYHRKNRAKAAGEYGSEVNLEDLPPRSPSRLEMRKKEPVRSSSRQISPLLLPMSALEGLSALQLAEPASDQSATLKNPSKQLFQSDPTKDS